MMKTDKNITPMGIITFNCITSASKSNAGIQNVSYSQTICAICNGFIAQQIHNKSYRWSLTFSHHECLNIVGLLSAHFMLIYSWSDRCMLTVTEQQVYWKIACDKGKE